jgi:uridine kinase
MSGSAMSDSPVAAVIALLARLPVTRVTLVAIDGHSAAGKSSLARAIAEVRGDTTLVHMDDFYRPLDSKYRAKLDAAGGCSQYYDWQRLEAEVLRPIRSGNRGTFRKYDWASNRLGERVDIASEGLIVVEGCYAARPELKAWYDATVLVLAQPATRRRRQQMRNDASPEWLERWDEAERYYMEECRPETYVDLTVAGE